MSTMKGKITKITEDIPGEKEIRDESSQGVLVENNENSLEELVKSLAIEVKQMQSTLAVLVVNKNENLKLGGNSKEEKLDKSSKVIDK